MSQDALFPPGARIGDYEVMSRLGRGGMGEVYLAQHVFLHKRYALKVLNEELARLPEFERVFRQEACTLAALRHPNIVQVHHFGEHAGRSYFVMDYVSGGTLEAHCASRGGRLPAGEALALLTGMADGLAYAHGMGVVHRDLKPENFLMEAGVPKITDFGLATLARGGAPASSAHARGDTYLHFAKEASEAPALTGGTDGYMAPELRAGEAGDARADIYAMGVIAHRLLTGRLPDSPSPRLAGDVADAAWEALLTRCLAESPQARFQDGAALVSALAALRERERTRPALPDWAWAFAVPLATLGVFAYLMATPVRVVPPPAPVSGAPATPALAPTVRLAAEDAELGYGLVCEGAPAEIVGWRPSSRAVWPRRLEAGRYRVSCFCRLSTTLDAAPVRVVLRAGDSMISCYLPVTAPATRPTKVNFGEIDLSNSCESIDLELKQGATEGTALRVAVLFFEPIP